MLFDTLGRARRGLLGARAVFGDPLLEPGERREHAVRALDLLEESRDEDRRERRVAVDERVQGGAERRPPLVVRGAQARRPAVGLLDLVEAIHRPQRHPSHVLDQPEPEHRGHRPELAEREGRALLERAHEQIDVV
jgi:hypothetical protein